MQGSIKAFGISIPHVVVAGFSGVWISKDHKIC